MALTVEEKGLIQEAVQVYIQIISRQFPPQQVQKIAQIAQNALKKIDNLDSVGKKGNKPAGISDEWFNHVCKTCDKLTATGCSEKVTEKYPGKCDPILKYEQEKKHG
ncbi:MAG: hypothetical protein JW795_01100 [Chitinivibrionales bacterium]|nr:hypothetical protein [Chitinivibrionales bacterium]